MRCDVRDVYDVVKQNIRSQKKMAPKMCMFVAVCVGGAVCYTSCITSHVTHITHTGDEWWCCSGKE